MAPKVLVVLTSQTTIPSTGAPTGWYLVSDSNSFKSIIFVTNISIVLRAFLF